MNEFHEINILTSRGDINGALLLIGKWSESIARKIMKKAGYSVTPHAMPVTRSGRGCRPR
ncbi:hypothetical protein [Pantoea agglomerans]|uniref:hypothetical protein n=1 Tax=Enterobacter agglomerans TaxID=549 RepID=UPI000F01A68D|nr:hypothetical protein [Pantoea agglomerans]AYP25833.1 hypothetical protein D0A61_23365 [Pantoea agglomerans]